MGVLWISSDGDDRMGAKFKYPKIPGPKINPPKIPCRIVSTFYAELLLSCDKRALPPNLQIV